MCGKLGMSVVAACLLMLAGCSGAGKLPERNLDGQLDPLRQSFAAHIHSSYPDAELPEVEFQRFVTDDNREEVLELCFDEYDVRISVDSDGGMSWSESSDAEAEKQWRAIFACSVRYPHHERRGLLMSEEELDFLYDYYLAVATPCIRLAGYPAPDLPGREQYKAQAYQWSVYDFVHAPRLGKEDQLRWSELMLRCPELPAGWDER